jgi:hypothetical protein
MRKTVRDLYLLTGLAVAAAGFVAAQNTEEAPQPPQQEPTTEDADAAPGEDVDEVFIPTEEILADEEVTFPVDI